LPASFELNRLLRGLFADDLADGVIEGGFGTFFFGLLGDEFLPLFV
jgi:hypothetical protein